MHYHTIITDSNGKGHCRPGIKRWIHKKTRPLPEKFERMRGTRLENSVWRYEPCTTSFLFAVLGPGIAISLMTEKVVIVRITDGGGVAYSLRWLMDSSANRIWPSIVITPILVTRWRVPQLATVNKWGVLDGPRLQGGRHSGEHWWMGQMQCGQH